MLAWFLLVVFATCALIGLCLLITLLFPKVRGHMDIPLTTGFVAILIAAFALISFYEFPALVTERRLYAIENGQATLKPYGAWESGDQELVWIFPTTCASAVESSVTMLTENPKLRKIYYGVSFYVGDEARFLVRSRNWKARDVYILVRSSLYEFNEKNSKELVGFYNPLLEEQQGRFRQLVADWVLNDFKKAGIEGLDVRVSNFMIE